MQEKKTRYLQLQSTVTVKHLSIHDGLRRTTKRDTPDNIELCDHRPRVEKGNETTTSVQYVDKNACKLHR